MFFALCVSCSTCILNTFATAIKQNKTLTMFMSFSTLALDNVSVVTSRVVFTNNDK